MPYQHALCLYPYVADQNPGVGLFPPTGLEYIATALKGYAGRISLVDLRHERELRPLKRMNAFIRQGAVDIVFASVYWKARYHRICEYIRTLPKGPLIVVGGREASDNVEDVFERCPNVAIVVRGEGEQTCQEIAAGRPWDRILGISYRCSGRIVHNANRPLQPLAEIAPPDRSLRRSRYFPTFRGARLMPVEFDTVLGSRGCPYKCTFCTFSLNPLGQKRDYTSRSPESVVDEIAASPADIILFADDNVFVEPKRTERICELLLQRGIRKRYVANARLEVSRFPRTLEKAYAAGFRMLLLGIESATDRILKELGKGFTTQQAREAFKVLRQFPFFYHAYFIYGNVGESRQEMLAISDFATELGVHAISLSRLRVDRFTPLRQVVERTPGYRISANGFVYSDRFDKYALRRIRNRIRNKFMYRPGHLARSLSTLHHSEIITYPQMARIAMAAPLFAWDYIAQHSRKRLDRWKERREKSKALPQRCAASQEHPDPPSPAASA